MANWLIYWYRYIVAIINREIFISFGRICTVISTRISYSLASLFDIQLKIYEVPYYPRELNGTETLDEIYQALQEDFKVEVKSLLDVRNTHPDFDKITLDKTAREFYIAYSKWCKEDYENALTKINNATISAFGFKKDFFENQKQINNRAKGVTCRLLLNLSQILYTISALVFIAALSLLSYKFIN